MSGFETAVRTNSDEVAEDLWKGSTDDTRPTVKITLRPLGVSRFSQGLSAWLDDLRATRLLFSSVGKGL